MRVEPVRRQRLAFGIKTNGRVEASPNHQVVVTNPTGGTVLNLYVQPGDRVEVGQPLALLTSPELVTLRADATERQIAAEAGLKQAQADLSLAQANFRQQQAIATAAIGQAQTAFDVAQERYERDRELLDNGAIPRRQVLESESQLATAQTDLEQARSRLAVLEAENQLRRAHTALDAAQSRLEMSDQAYQARLRQLDTTANPDGTVTVLAPIAGVVAERSVTLGQSAQDAGATLMTLIDPQSVMVTADLYEKDLDQVAVGQAVRITVAGLPNRIFSGRVQVIGAAVEREQRVIPVQVGLDPLDEQLQPGRFATLEILTEQTPQAVLAVPQSALVEQQGQSLVYVQNGQTFEPVEVQVGRVAGDQVEIEQGLFEGDQVVTQGAALLYAQSLRGGSAPNSSDQVDPPAPQDSESDRSWHWLAISSSVALGTFGLGLAWGRRRRRGSGLMLGSDRERPDPLEETARGTSEGSPTSGSEVEHQVPSELP